MGQTEKYARERRTGRINSLVIDIYHGAIKIIAENHPEDACNGRGNAALPSPDAKLSTIEHFISSLISVG